MITLENNNIKLRALEPTDIDTLYDWENNQEIWQVSNTIVPFSKYILAKYINNSHLDIYQTKQLRLIIEKKEDDKFHPVGMIDIFDFDPFHQRAGLGIFVNKMYRDQGIASSALKLTIEYCFKTIGLHQLFCNITTDNNTSINLFKKQSFEIIGTKKDWVKMQNGWKDEYLLQLIK